MNLNINFQNTQDAEQFVDLLWQFYTFFEDLDSKYNLKGDEPLDILHSVWNQAKVQVNNNIIENIEEPITMINNTYGELMFK